MIDISEFEDRTSIAHAALRVLQENNIHVPKPIKMVANRSKEIAKEKSKIFGVALADIEERDDVLLDEHVSCDVPHFLAECLTYLEEYVTVEGLFRKAGSVARQKDIKATMEFGGVFPAGRPHDVASLLKMFLRELPEPLLTRRFSKVFSDCVVASSSQDLALVACLMLPIQHLQCLQFLMRFLQRLSTQSQANKMDLHSLAVVMTPNLFQLAMPDSVANSQLNLTSYTAAVEHLISHADEIGSVPNDVAKRALQLSKEFEGNLPPLLLAFNGGREATDFGVRRSMRRVRRKSASFSDLVKGLGNSISRFRKSSPKKSSLCQETGSGSGAGSSVTLCRKESVKRRAECTTSGTYAKRRAVHESPDGTPTASKKGKRKSGLFRRKGKKSRHKGKSLAAPSPCHVVVRKLTDSDGQLISSPIDCSSDGVILLDGAAPTPISNQSEDDAETDSKWSCDSTSNESQFGRIDFGNGDSAAATPCLSKYSYQVVTSDGTLVKCLSQAEKVNSHNLKFSEVQRKRAVNASADSPASDVSDKVTCLSHDREETEVVQSWEGVTTPLVCKPARRFHGNRSQYQLRSSNLARQAAILPSKMQVIPTPTSKSRAIPASTPSSSKLTRLIGKSKSDCSMQGLASQGYDFTPFVKETSLDHFTTTPGDSTPRFTGSQAVERQLISSAATAAAASRKRRSTGMSLQQRFTASGADCKPLPLPTTAAGWTKLKKSPDKLGRRSLDSVVITSSLQGLTPSHDFQFSVPNERQRNSPAIGRSCSNAELDTEQEVGEFHFSAPQEVGMTEDGGSANGDARPCSETEYKKLELESSCGVPGDPTGQLHPLETAVSPNLLEQISMEILERKKTEDQNAIDEEFLLKCTKEVKAKNSRPSPRKTRGCHSRRSSSYRLALQPSTSDTILSLRSDGYVIDDPFHNCLSVEPGVDLPVEAQKKNGQLLPAATSALLPRRRRSTTTGDVDPLAIRAEIAPVPTSGSGRDLGNPTPKMTGPSSLGIGYVKSQVKKFSGQFLQSPVMPSVTVPREPLKAINTQQYITSSSVAKNSIRQVSKEWLV